VGGVRWENKTDPPPNRLQCCGLSRRLDRQATVPDLAERTDDGDPAHADRPTSSIIGQCGTHDMPSR
jgi:hypothetical protein